MIIAINYITCTEACHERIESLMRTRMGAIDKMDGFQRMKVLCPNDLAQNYLIMSEWDSEEAFKAWIESGAFIEGHRRSFADIDEAKKRREKPPMTSRFQTYDVIAT